MHWLGAVALFVAGSVFDVALAPSNTLIGPMLVALWWGATSSRREVTACMYVLGAAFAVATVVSIAEPAALPLPHDDDGVVRAAALGLLLAAGGLLSVRHGARARVFRAGGRRVVVVPPEHTGQRTQLHDGLPSEVPGRDK